MTPEQFRHLRESRNETRAELAEILGISSGAIVQWERGTRGIPKWAAEKMFKTVNVTLPIQELSLLLDEAARRNLNFSDYLAEIIRRHIATGNRTAPAVVPENNETSMVAEPKTQGYTTSSAEDEDEEEEDELKPFA